MTDNRTLKVANNVHKQSGMGVEYILKNSLLRRTLDNVTVVMIAFSNFKRAVFGESSVRHQEKLEAKENIPPSTIAIKIAANVSGK